MKTEYSTSASLASLMQDVVLLLQSNDPENAQVMDMLTKAKRNYVKERHPRMISQIHSKSKYKDGKWKTYVYVDEKRKVVEANTEEELYTWLYDFYKAQDDAEKTFEDVFMMLEDKKRRDGRTDQTLREDKRHFGFLSEEIRSKVIAMNSHRLPIKGSRMRPIMGHRLHYKRMIITLQPGYSIPPLRKKRT